MTTALKLSLLGMIFTEVLAIDADFQAKQTFKINVILQFLNSDSGINYQSGVMMSEAIRYAVDKINSNSSHLSGYKLQIFNDVDSGSEMETRHRVLDTFKEKVPFLIGPHTSELSYVASILTGTFHQITVSHSASYRDFKMFGPRYGTMVRTIPSDEFRVQAAVEFLEKIKTNYVAVVSSFGYNGERESIPFLSNVSDINICLSMHIKLKKLPSKDDYENAIALLESDIKLKLIVLFTTREDSRNLLRFVEKKHRRFQFICMYGCTNYLEVVEGIEEKAINVLSIDIHYPELPDFKKHFLALKPSQSSSKYFLMYWQSVFNCSFLHPSHPCTGKEQLSEKYGYFPLTPVYTVIEAVDAIGTALRKLIQERCLTSHSINQCLLNASDVSTYTGDAFSNLLRLSYQDGTIKSPSYIGDVIRYDIHKFSYVNNTYKNIYVGKWETKRNNTAAKKSGDMQILQVWEKYLMNKPAVCGEACPNGHIKQWSTDPLKRHCCWTCLKCQDNTIAVNETCQECKYTEKANIISKNCEPLPERIMELKDNPVTVVFMFFCIIGMCCDGLVIGLFIKYNDCRFVRASGRDLCYMMLFGIFIIFMSPFSFLGYPTLSTCVLRSALPGVGFLACYAPLFLKTNRIYRIFCHAQKSIQRPSLVSSRSLLLISTGIVMSQILLVSVWFISDAPDSVAVLSANHQYVTIHCRGDTSPVLLFLNVILSVIFMISCTVLAFKTRHFPKNYNEAKYIGITLYVTCVAWSIFLPAYFLIPETGFAREYCMNSISIIIGFVTLFGLFGQKVKLLLFQDNLINVKENLPTWYLSESKEQSDSLPCGERRCSNMDDDIM